MYFNKEKWFREFKFTLFTMVLAYAFFYLITHKRPHFCLAAAVGIVLFGIVTNLVMNRGKSSLYFIFVLVPIFPFLRVQLLRFQIIGTIVMFVLSRWSEFIMVLALFGRKWGGIRRLYYSAPLLDLLIIFYIFIGFAHFLQSISRNQLMMGLWGVKEIYFFYVYYFLARFIPCGKKDLKNFLTISAAIATGIAAFGCIQSWFFGDELLKVLGYGFDVSIAGDSDFTMVDTHLTRYFPGGGSIVRAVSLLQDPLSLGAYMMFMILLLQPFYFLPEDKSHQKAKYLQYMILIACLVFTTTRSSWVGTAVGTLVIAWRRKLFLQSMAVFLAIGICALPVVFAIPGMSEFIMTSIFNPGSESSASNHMSMYGWQFQKIIDNPLGLGIGMTGRIGRKFGAALFGGFNTECDYLQVGTMMGWPGLILYIGIYIEIIRKLFLLGTTLKDPFLRNASNGLLGSFIGCAVFGIFLNVWTLHVFPILMHLLLGMALFYFPSWDEDYTPPDTPLPGQA